MKKTEIKSLEKQIIPITKKALTCSIESQKDLIKATEILTLINTYADSVKKSKEAVTKPLNEALKATRTMFKPLEDKLNEAIMVIRKEMTNYQTEQMRQARLEAEKVATGEVSIESAVALTPDKKVASKSGSITFVTVKKFEIEDITKVPKDYIMLNEVAVRQALSSGIKLAGIRYWDEQTPRNSR